MRNFLDNDALMDGLKHASNMLAELRTSSLAPKSYYQLYMAIFDSLRHLTSYFVDIHQSGKHHLADVYELVQYAGNIIPRLYLMITVGGAYMSIPDAPVQEIMCDMLEMVHGVQHPMRGLFLRHYLSGMTRDHLPIELDKNSDKSIYETIKFTLDNFVEMNKLWIRLQHLGHSREKEKRNAERQELRILVGTNLERLSQLDGVNLEIYRTAILPDLLNEIVNCHDSLAQEYLMDIIIQVFPDEFHLQTLEPFLSAIAKLHPKVNIKQIIVAIINRLAMYADYETEQELERQKLLENEVSKNSSLLIEKNGNEQKNENNKDVKEKVKVDDHDDHENNSNKKETESTNVNESLEEESIEIVYEKTTSSLSTQQNDKNTNMEEQCQETEISDKVNNVKMVHGIPENVELFVVFWEQIIKLVKERKDLSIQDIMELLVAITNLSLSCYPERLDYLDQILIYCKDRCLEYANSTDLHSKITEEHILTLLLAPIQQYDSILTLLMLQNYYTVFEVQPYNSQRRLALAIVKSILSKETLIEKPDDVHTILELCKVLLLQNKKKDSAISTSPFYYDEEDTMDDQIYIAKLIHLFQSKENDEQFLLLSATRRQLGEDEHQIKHTFPPLITSALKLSHRYQNQIEQDEIWEKKTAALFRFIHQVISLLYSQCESSMSAFCLRYYIMAGQSADVSGFEDLAYEFFVQAFNVYEESVSDSKSQYQAIIFIIGSLYQTTGFSKENYTSLITKAALHGSKLLKKPDQCRAVYLASHLWRNSDNDNNIANNSNSDHNNNDLNDDVHIDDAHNDDVHNDDDKNNNNIEVEDEEENENKEDSDFNDNDDKENRNSNSDQEQQTLIENKRILECLQKALKIADSCMDPVVNLELFVEILNQCMFYFEQNNKMVTTKYINGLIEMIKASLSSLDDADEYTFTSSSSSILQQKDGISMAKYVRRHFNSTLKLLKDRQELGSNNDQDNKYKDIVI
ncbi:unnamed protein product [Cunninghamella blakesleeana]